MSLRSQFKMDAARQENGAPMRLKPNADGSIPTFWIRRVGAADGEYNKAVERVMAPHRRAQETGALPEGKHRELARQIFAEAGIAKMENVLLSDVLDDDKQTGFAEDTYDNRVALLTNLPELHADLRVFAVVRDNYLAANVEADAKN